MARKDDYIPVSDGDMQRWLAKFDAYVMGHLDELGLKPEHVAFLADEKAEYDAALADHRWQKVLATAAVRRKRTARTRLEAHIRPLARLINAQPQVSNDIRSLMGLNLVTGERVRREVGKEIPGLYVRADNGMVTIHFGTTPMNEQTNGRPKWAFGCNVYRKKEGEKEFRLIDFATASPYYDRISGEAALYTYMVRYRGRKNHQLGKPSNQYPVAVRGVATVETAA